MHSLKTLAILNCAQYGHIWIKPRGAQNKSFTDGNIGFLLMSGSSSTSLSRSCRLVIVKGWKVAELKTPKKKAAWSLWFTLVKKTQSSSSLMCQDNRQWIFYKSSVWKPIKLSCGNDGPSLLPSTLSKRFQQAYSLINLPSMLLRYNSLPQSATL